MHAVFATDPPPSGVSFVTIDCFNWPPSTSDGFNTAFPVVLLVVVDTSSLVIFVGCERLDALAMFCMIPSVSFRDIDARREAISVVASRRGRCNA